jgi:hypothetical protein
MIANCKILLASIEILPV